MSETLEFKGDPEAILSRLAELGISAEIYVAVHFPDLPIAIVAPGDTLTLLSPEEGYRITHPRPES